MSELLDVIKRTGERPSEEFQPSKLYSSVQAACHSVHTPEGEAHTTARSVLEAVTQWCSGKSEITSDDIRRISAHHLDKLHPEAAYIYINHRLVL